MMKKVLSKVSELGSSATTWTKSSRTTALALPSMWPDLYLGQSAEQVPSAVRVVSSMDCQRLYPQATGDAQRVQCIDDPTDNRILANSATASPRGSIAFPLHDVRRDLSRTTPRYLRGAGRTKPVHCPWAVRYDRRND